MRERIIKKFLTIMLTMSLCISVLPLSTLADDELVMNGSLSEEYGEVQKKPQDQDTLLQEKDDEITDPSGQIPDPASDTRTSSDDPQDADFEDWNSNDEPQEPAEGLVDPAGAESDQVVSDDEQLEIADPSETEDFDPALAPKEGVGTADQNENVIVSVKTAKSSYSYTGKKIKPVLIVTGRSGSVEKELTAGTDYSASYKNNLNAGTATVTVKGKGEFTGSVQTTFKIKAAAIRSLTLKNRTRIYSGNRITHNKTAVVTARVNGAEKVLEYGTDYILTYSKNVYVGTAVVTAEGIGNYRGSLSESYQILPQTPKIASATAGTGKFTVKWNKQTVQTTGFLLQYCLKADFSSGKKTVTVKSSTAAAKTISGVTAGKTWYIRIRAYKTVDGEKYYSAWSEVKSVNLKYNTVSITGKGAERTVTVLNPKNISEPSIAFWSKTEGQDDLRWLDLSKTDDGSYQTVISAGYLKHYGTCYVHLYDEDEYLLQKTFSFSKADYDSAENVLTIDGSGVMLTLHLLKPVSGLKKVRAAIWSGENGFDDLAWFDLKKQKDGSFETTSNFTNLLHSGICCAHVYAGTDTFIGSLTFSVHFGMEPCSSEEEYIEKIAPAVQRVCKRYGYLPSVLIAQSCLENGYGIPSYWDNPEISGLIYYCNMVGLKSELLSSSWTDKTVWTGRSIVKKTPEVYNGKPVTITDSFRIYDDIEQSFADFMLFLTYASNYGAGGTPKYGPSVISIKSPKKLIKAVAGRGYATGPTYPDSVMRIIKKHDLTKYDDLTGVEPTIYTPGFRS